MMVGQELGDNTDALGQVLPTVGAGVVVGGAVHLVQLLSTIRNGVEDAVSVAGRACVISGVAHY